MYSSGKYRGVAWASAATMRRPTDATMNAVSQTSGRDMADLALAAMRLQAQIDKRIDEYQKRPRKQFIGANPQQPDAEPALATA